MVNFYRTVRRRDSERAREWVRRRDGERERETLFDGTFWSRSASVAAAYITWTEVKKKGFNVLLKKRTNIRTPDGGHVFFVGVSRFGETPRTRRSFRSRSDVNNRFPLGVQNDRWASRARVKRRERKPKIKMGATTLSNESQPTANGISDENPSTGKLKHGRDNNGSPFSHSGPNTVDNSPVRLCRYLEPLRNGA